ncbi:MAG: hypothetical protein RI937_1504 [Pseudomonadota bacterium]
MLPPALCVKLGSGKILAQAGHLDLFWAKTSFEEADFSYVAYVDRLEAPKRDN